MRCCRWCWSVQRSSHCILGSVPWTVWRGRWVCPRLRPDFSDAEWETVEGSGERMTWPRCSASDAFQCFHFSIDSVSDDVMMSSFHNSLSSTERSAVAKAGQDTLEDWSDEEDLLDLFTRMGSHCIPPTNTMKVATQTSKSSRAQIYNRCFSKTMPFALLNVPDQESLLSLYDTKKHKSVTATSNITGNLSQISDQIVFNHLQRYIRNAEQSLHFCSGSSVICVDQIKVIFDADSGLSRRPVAHTCGSPLDLPYTYSSDPDLHTEFDTSCPVNTFIWTSCESDAGIGFSHYSQALLGTWQPVVIINLLVTIYVILFFHTEKNSMQHSTAVFDNISFKWPL